MSHRRLLAPIASLGPVTISARSKTTLEHAEVIFGKWFRMRVALTLSLVEAGESLTTAPRRKHAPPGVAARKVVCYPHTLRAKHRPTPPPPKPRLPCHHPSVREPATPTPT